MSEMPVAYGKALQTQIDELGERMDEGFKELKDMFRGFEERVRTVEQREAGCQPLIQSRLDAAWRQIDTNTSSIKMLTETIVALKHTNNILTWLGGIMGSAIIIWILGQILGLIK